MYTPAQLARLLGLAEPTTEQAAVIAAPLEPLAVIAGAGSGKSETMAARLVWLVANGMVRPERVLGLTFTRKAAGELGERVRARLDGLRRAGLAAGPEAAAPDDSAEGPLAGEPVVSTYHAYAARLVTDHALREALEPTLRLITPAVAWQVAASVVAAYGGPMDAVTWAPPSVTAAVLTLAGELAEHLRSPEDVVAVGEWLDTESVALAGKLPGAVRKILESQRTREQLLPMVGGTPGPRPSGKSSTMATRWPWPRGSPPATPRSARPSAAGTRWCCSMSTRTPVTPSSSCCGPCSAAATR